MRILSQDADGIGMFDIPYELCVVSTGKNKKTGKSCIYVRCNLFGEYSVVAAEYSSPEKVKKAMEMLRKAYSPVLIIQNQDDGIKPNIKPNDWLSTPALPTQRVEVADNFYFKFPLDDEVEVSQ